MQITLTSKRQATFPVEVCRALNLVPGSRLELVPSSQPGEWILRPVRIREERLAPLKSFIPKNVPDFRLETFRASPKDYASLRD